MFIEIILNIKIYFIFYLFLVFVIFYICFKICYLNYINYSKNKTKLIFINYTSSNLESEWLYLLSHNKNNYTSRYCSLIKPFKQRLEKLKLDIRNCRENKYNKCDGNDLSYFIYKHRNGTFTKEYIEPLFGILRNTFAVCNKGRKGNITSKDYLLPSYIISLINPIIYIDAGASTFYDGAGGSSQSFIYNLYKNLSSTPFRKWFLWEIQKHNISKIMNEIPEDLKTIYHYHNRGIETNIKSNDNPLNYIKKYQHKDFVIFKLDVDTPSVELPIFNYLLKFNNILPHEFYFEYHFFEPFMMKHGWGKRVDKNCSLYCATKKFIMLRIKGIRSHPWV